MPGEDRPHLFFKEISTFVLLRAKDRGKPACEG